jgi:hypothetical protein
MSPAACASGGHRFIDPCAHAKPFGLALLYNATYGTNGRSTLSTGQTSELRVSDPDEIIRRIHAHVEDGDIDKTVVACLRLSRYIGDHFNAVMFLRELRPDHHQFKQQYCDEVKLLSAEAQKHIWTMSWQWASVNCCAS